MLLPHIKIAILNILPLFLITGNCSAYYEVDIQVTVLCYGRVVLALFLMLGRWGRSRLCAAENGSGMKAV
jgi:hypothetical protein